MEFDAQKQAGTFKGDVLIAALGKEHPGRTRGVGVYAAWKTGRDWTLEKKRESKKARKELEKAEMIETIRAQVMKEVCAKLGLDQLPPLTGAYPTGTYPRGPWSRIRKAYQGAQLARKPMHDKQASRPMKPKDSTWRLRRIPLKICDV